MKLPPSVTTVTTFSKLLALFLFILFPIVGFYLGMTYQQSVIPVNQPELLVQPTQAPNESTGWKTYTSTELGISFKYPPEFRVAENYLKGTGLYDEGIFIDYNQTGGMPPRWMKITSSTKSSKWNINLHKTICATSIGQTYQPDKNGESYTRLPDEIVVGTPVCSFESPDMWETPPPLKGHIIERDGTYYVIAFTLSNVNDSSAKDELWAQVDYVKIFSRILSTFTFTDSGQVKEENIASCSTDTDCIVVAYSSCCGGTKRAINKIHKAAYDAHPTWQRFSDENACALMGRCPSDEQITEAFCDNQNQCQLKY